jgi:hypothetical protein
VPVAIFVGVLLSQLVWAWSTPPFRGVDEIDHVFRAASVARGDIRATELPADGRGALGEVPPGLVRDAQRQCLALEYDGRSNCIPERTLPNGNEMIASSAAPYSPVVYAVIGTLAKPWDGVTALFVMRGIACVLNALILAAAAWCLMCGSRTAWPITGLVLGLTPMAIYTTMVPSPNGVELASATLLWCALLGLQRAEGRLQGRLFAAAGLAGVVLGSVRLTGPIFILLIVGTVAAVDLGRTLDIVRTRWRAALMVALLTVAATAYQVYWMLTQPPVSALDSRRPFDLGVILGQVLLWVFQWIGAFPLRGEPTSSLTYIACGVAFVAVFVEAFRRGDRVRRIAVVVVVLCLLLPFVYTLLTFTSKGTFWQGRYALPFACGLPLLAGWVLDAAPPRAPLSKVAERMLPFAFCLAQGIALCGVVGKQKANWPEHHGLGAPPILLLVGLTAVASVLVWVGFEGARRGSNPVQRAHDVRASLARD